MDIRVVCGQVPQELARLTTLTHLSLSRNAADSTTNVPLKVAPDGRILVPEMKVTEWNCRFMLGFPGLAFIGLSVTEEEKAALSELLSTLQENRKGAIRFCLASSEDFTPENAGPE